MANVRVRFAPSPTGYLHIGGVRTALFNWLWAKKNDGVFVLRIEDTDQERSTDASVNVILDSMRWLGMDWNEGPGAGGAHGPYTQMERLGLYKEWSEKLIAAGKAFRCFCTKEELDAQRAALKAKDPKAQFRYPGTCRDRKDEPNLPYVVRFKAPTHGAVRYVDKVFGEVVTPNDTQQDFVLVRSDGIPLYNFGCVVDDVTMEISLVARGRDHMINTPPQILLYEALGAKLPDFAHLPMILAPDGKKLSKRSPPKGPDGAPIPVSVEEYRERGYSPEAVLNYLVRFGWSHGDKEVFSRAELVDTFNWEACGRGDGKFDAKKFLAIDHEHLKTPALTPDDVYLERLVPFLEARGLTFDRAHVKKSIPMIRERATTFADAADRLDFVYREPPVMDEKARDKFLVAANVPHLRGFADVLEKVEPFAHAPLEAATNAWLAEKSLNIKDVAQPARVALTGRTATPGLFEVIEALGRDRTLARLRGAADDAAKR